MSYSNLVSYYRPSANRQSRMGHAVKGFAIHCFVGQIEAKRGVDYFCETDRSDAPSANYVIGYDGQIGCAVDDEYRSNCTSDSIDEQIITIEMACEATHPYKVTDEAYAALIDLLTDRCRAHGIKKLIWKEDKAAALRHDLSEQNMVVHRWYDSKACPGDYLYNLHYQIANEVNARLDGEPYSPPSRPAPAVSAAPEYEIDWCQPDAPIIGVDDEGNAVEMLQTMLIRQGYELPEYGIDGDFGEETEKAVMEYQGDHRLDVDGVVGAQTWGSLLKY